MKVLIATGLYPPQIGGPATYTVFLEKHLPLHGITPVVLPYGRVHRYPKILRHFLFTLMIIMKARKVDVLYALDTVSVGLPVRIASLLTRTPYMLRVPGDYAWEQGQQRYGVKETLDVYLLHRPHHPMVRLMAAIQRHVAVHATHVIVPSEYLKGVVVGWGVSSERVTRVYSALKEIVVADSKEVLRQKYGYSSWTITTAGRLVPWKGMHAVIRVIKRLKNEGISAHLEIIGDGVSRNELEGLVGDLELSDSVIFRGAVSRDELAERIKASDAFVLNTSYEGLSHQLIEVMYLGVPIVTTHVGGNPELITHEKTGLLVAYNDEEALYAALMRYHTQGALSEGVAREAKRRVQAFHEDAVVTEFITCMKKIWKY